MRSEKKRFPLDTFPLLEWPVESSKLDNKVLLGILIYQGHHSASIHRSLLKLSQSVALLGESLKLFLVKVSRILNGLKLGL